MDKKNIFLSSNIKYLRNIVGKTQEEIAKICNKKNTAVSNWEKGIREPDAVDLTILANIFNVSVDDLMLKDLRFDNSYTENKTKTLNILYDKLKDLPEDKQKMILNVTEAVMKDIDDQLDNK